MRYQDDFSAVLTPPPSGISGPDGIAIWLFMGTIFAVAALCFLGLIDQQVAAYVERRRAAVVVKKQDRLRAWFWFRGWDQFRRRYPKAPAAQRARSRTRSYKALNRVRKCMPKLNDDRRAA